MRDRDCIFWNAVEQGPHRDVLGDVSSAVRAAGVRVEYYHSLYECYNPLYLTDKNRYVAEHVHPQSNDPASKYQPDIIFCDGEWEKNSAE